MCLSRLLVFNLLVLLAICINATNIGCVGGVKLMANYDSSDLLCEVISLACLAAKQVELELKQAPSKCIEFLWLR